MKNGKLLFRLIKIKNATPTSHIYLNNLLDDLLTATRDEIDKENARKNAEIPKKPKFKKACVLCFPDLDEADAGGLWDLSADICAELLGAFNGDGDAQDNVYQLLRYYISTANFCPLCGRRKKARE